MGRRLQLGTIAVGAALMLLCLGDRACGQRNRAGGRKAQITTRPIPTQAEHADYEQEDAAPEGELRQASGDSPVENELRPVAEKKPAKGAKPTRAAGSLPNDHGQVWREYDLTPYVSRVADNPRPEQAVVDWILRETGYESWHTEPLAILSASPETLRVYHTPAMQATVAEIVERFVNEEEATHVVSLRVVSLGAAHWRAQMPARLSPVEVQSPGLQAWLMAKEEAGILLAELSKRKDFKEYGSPQQLVLNGQPTVISTVRTRNYTQHLLPGIAGVSVYEPRSSEIEEGIAVELTPLVSSDGESIDAVLRCNIDQLERVIPISLESNLPTVGRERTKVEVPQRSQLRVKETFRWNTPEVLVVSLGMAPAPDLAEASLLEKAIPLSLPTTAPRAEVLLILESRGRRAVGDAQDSAKSAPTAPHGRY
jgi:hypothetical protein